MSTLLTSSDANVSNQPNNSRVPTGSQIEVKRLYNHSIFGIDDCNKWSEFADPLEEERRCKESGQPFAIVHRLSRKGGDEKGYYWETHSIEVQCPRLKEFLESVFKDYPDWYPDGTPYTFFPPFKPFVHRWDKFLEASRQRLNVSEETEIAFLYGEMKRLLEPRLSDLEQIKATGVASFESLWLVFAPGDHMVTNETGNLCVSKLRKVKFVEADMYTPAYWKVTLDRVDWNGSYCGFAKKVVRVYKFAEPQFARGKKFAALRGNHVKNCVGKKYVIGEDAYGCPKETEKPVGLVCCSLSRKCLSKPLHRCPGAWSSTLMRTTSAKKI